MVSKITIFSYYEIRSTYNYRKRGLVNVDADTPTMTTIFLIDSDTLVNFDSVREAVNYYFTTMPLGSPFFKRLPSLPNNFIKITYPDPWNGDRISR